MRMPAICITSYTSEKLLDQKNISAQKTNYSIQKQPTNVEQIALARQVSIWLCQ